jgi:uncharacterized protein (DUF111 family)
MRQLAILVAAVTLAPLVGAGALSATHAAAPVPKPAILCPPAC